MDSHKILLLLTRDCYKALLKRDPKYTELNNKGLIQLEEYLYGIGKDTLDWTKIGYLGEPMLIGVNYVSSRKLFLKYRKSPILKNAKYLLRGSSILFVPKMSGFNEVTDISYAFESCTLLLNLADDLSFENVTVASGAFNNASNLLTFNKRVGLLLNANNMFNNCHLLYEIKYLPDWDMTKCKSTNSMFGACYQLREFDLRKWKLNSVTNLSSMFYECTRAQHIRFENLISADGPYITSVAYMFWHCWNLKSTEEEPLLVDNFVRANPNGSFVDSRTVFGGCSSIEYLDLRTWDTHVMLSWSSLFSQCNKLLKIDGVLDMLLCNHSLHSTRYMFLYDGALKEVWIKNLHADLGLPSINLECFAYLLQNAIGGEVDNPIIITYALKKQFEASEYGYLKKYYDPADPEYRWIDLRS